MKVLVELRIPMPLTVEELELGMLHTIVEVPVNLRFLIYPHSPFLFSLLSSSPLHPFYSHLFSHLSLS